MVMNVLRTCNRKQNMTRMSTAVRHQFGEQRIRGWNARAGGGAAESPGLISQAWEYWQEKFAGADSGPVELQ